MKTLFVIALLLVPTLTLLQQEEAKPKYTIKQVMKKAHKDKLIKKVVKGEASQDEKMMLLDLYLSLPENKPPKGDENRMEPAHNGSGRCSRTSRRRP